MAGLSQILKESGHDVSGSDVQFYPPMSDYLTSINIKTIQGYEAKLLPKADLYVIGNALSRGNESVEHILSKNLPYASGPEILGSELKDRNVYAVSGTHGKTSTAYMLTHILDYNGKDVGYLVGGISENFKNPARLGKHKSFVIINSTLFTMMRYVSHNQFLIEEARLKKELLTMLLAYLDSPNTE